MCRALGGSGYDSESEAETFVQTSSWHTGIPALKERLQPLYIELIRSNLPNLEKNALVAKTAAEAALRKLGDTPLGSIPMIREAQRSLKLPHHSFTACITPAVDRFREAVHATSERITPEFVKGLVKHDAFMCPFFQGEAAFAAGMAAIVDWWRPPTDRFIKEVAVALEASMSSINEEAIGVSERLRAALKEQWLGASVELVKTLRAELMAILTEERYFGTVNHYIQQKYVEEQLMPDALIESVVAGIFAGRAYDQNTNLSVTPAIVRKCLLAVRDAAVAAEKQATIGQYVSAKVLCALKANWSVEKKTFTDMLLKKTRDAVVMKREEFIDLMIADQSLCAEAVEDDDIVERRQALKATIEAMNAVIVEVQALTGGNKRKREDASSS